MMGGVTRAMPCDLGMDVLNLGHIRPMAVRRAPWYLERGRTLGLNFFHKIND